MKKIIIGIVSLILAGSICYVILLLNSKEESTEKNVDESNLVFDEITLEYYEEANLSDYIIGNDIKVSDSKIDTSILGNQVIDITYYIDEESFSETLHYNVVDTTAPVVLMKTNYTILVGSEFNFESTFIIADNYDKKPSCKIIGEYDENLIGTYELNVTCTDSNENKNSTDFTLDIVAEIESSSYDPTILYFEDVVENYKTDNTKIGLDVSKWQGNIDFESVKEAGAEFVIIRAGYSTKDGDFYEDSYFQTNLKKAKSAGLDVGVYFYSQSISTGAAEAEALFVLDLLDGETLELPISYDWEIWSSFNDLYMSLVDFNEMKNTFIDTVESFGYDGMNYGSLYYLRSMFDKSSDTWVAHYEISETTYEYDYSFWQMTSAGKIDGIDGYVDINIMYK